MSPCRNDKTLWGWAAAHIAAFRHTLDNGKLTENDSRDLVGVNMHDDGTGDGCVRQANLVCSTLSDILYKKIILHK
ncbi:hypothetical protein Peur_045161 [Populus x canadensis]|jgi:hypothetical protein